MWKINKQLLFSFLLEIFFIVTTAWLFFDFSVISILLFFYLPFALKKRWQENNRQKKWELNLAFKDAIICLENSLAVGYSPESSLKETAKELEQLYGKEAELCLEFRQMIKQIDLGNTMEKVFLDFGRRSNIEDIRQLAEIFSVVKRTGGNLGEVLRQISGVLQDKIELKRDLHIVIAAKKMEFQVMCFVPYGILFYLKLCASSMIESLYHTSFGVFFMSTVFIVYIALKFFGERIVDGEIRKVVGNLDG